MMDSDIKRIESDIEETFKFLQKCGHSATVVSTRRLITTKGIQQALSDLMRTSQVQAGFTKLAEKGRLDLTFESLIIRYPSLFDDEIIERAKKRLK